MNNAKTTRRALLTSVVALVICLTMLMGTTFAWFTDTASVNVNKIQSGTLDIDLVDANGATLVGKGALNFIKADKSTEILWEPGCTYKLPEVYVKNNGNLDLKYQIVITGIKGDAKLNEAIEWTIELGGKTFAATDWLTLDASAKSEALTISGHMKEDAGNEYQDLTIDGIAITVNATQLNSEYDSINNTYDKDAPDLISVNGKPYTTLNDALVAANAGDTIIVSGNVVYTMPNDANADIDFKGVTIAADASNKLATVITFKNAEGSNQGGANNTISNVTIKNVSIVDETFYTFENGENAWEFTYLEMSNVTAENVVFTDGIILDGTNTFTGCTFIGHNNDSSDLGNGAMYGAWVSSGSATFTGCTFTGTRGLKTHDGYTEGNVTAVTVDGCTFDNLTEKPGVAIGTHTVATVTIKNSAFNYCQPGDLNLYIYETDSITPVLENNTVEYTVEVTDQAGLNDAIANSTGDVTVELPAGTYTLPTVDNKDVTIIGTKDTIVDMSSNISSNGASLTFDGVTVNFDNDDYEGFQHSEKVVYENCVINGVQFLYSDAEFTNCTFNVTGDAYAVWTYGAKSVTFTDCTFNTNGKAVLVYTEAAHTATITATGCTFNDNGGVDGKAAIEVGESAYGNLANYTIKLDNCTVNGFDVNSVSNSNVWGNKNSIPTDRLNVVIDGTDVY